MGNAIIDGLARGLYAIDEAIDERVCRSIANTESAMRDGTLYDLLTDHHFVESGCITQGWELARESSFYQKFSTLVQKYWDEDSEFYGDDVADEDVEAIRESFYNLRCSLGSDFDRMHDLSSENAAFDEGYTCGYLDAWLVFLKAFDFAEDEDINRYRQYIFELIEG